MHFLLKKASCDNPSPKNDSWSKPTNPRFRNISLFLVLLIGMSTLALGADEIANQTLAKETMQAGQEVGKVKVEQPKLTIEEEIKILQEGKIPEVLARDALASNVVGKRPDENKGPTYVKIGFYVYDISYINDALQTFNAKVRLVARWYDPRLAKNTAEVRQFPLDAVWNPLIQLINTRNVEAKFPDSVFVDHKGQVIYAQTYSGTFTVPLNLSNFPLDKHRLKILIRSYYSPENVKLFIDERLTGWPDILSIPDWIVSKGETKIEPYYLKEQNREQSQMTFSFEIARRVGFFLWKVVLPMSLIVLMSWGVFWISAERLEARVTISATAFLTLFAFQFAIAALLPKIGYLTRMDRYTMLCYIFVLLALIETVIANIQARKKTQSNPYVIDKTSRILFPITFILASVFLFFT